MQSLISFFLKIEKSLYNVRDILWSIPDLFSTNYKYSPTRFLRLSFFYSKPYSTILSGIFIAIIVPLSIFAVQQLFAATSNSVLIEAVVMGEGQNGQIQQLPKVNPIIQSSIQLEKDLVELIYEPLIRYNSQGELEEVLVTEIVRIKEGAVYNFTLEEGVEWHDSFGGSKPLEVEDIFATFDLLLRLQTTESDSSGLSVQGVDSAYVQAVSQMAWERTGPREFLVCTLVKPEDRDLERPCTSVEDERPILSNFLELVGFKIIPKEYAEEINIVNFNTIEPSIYSRPIGTGPYIYQGATLNRIDLVKNNNYHGKDINLDAIRFQFYASENTAIEAVQNSQVHTYASGSSQSIRETERYPQISLNFSSALENQYWGIYFNLRKDTEDNPIGPDFFQEVSVREGISLAINRSRLIDSVLGLGKEAFGPISSESDFFNTDTEFPTFDPEEANIVLEKAGWKINADTNIREKDGQELSFKLTYADNLDRGRIVESIRQDLSNVGIDLIKDPQAPEVLSTQYVLPKLYDALLYGVGTFIDPDRYELFHSEESRLNFSSYTGEDDTVVIRDNKKSVIPKVDNLLELGRRFDPLDAKKERIENYRELQDLIAKDVPVVFLYNPRFVYYANQRVRNIDLSNLNNFESRFLNIEDWYLD